MRDRIPHFAVDSVPNCGLHVHEERPDVVVAEVLKLVGKAGEVSRNVGN
jgi:pimeloyl-ACP methyl ester carboxylesterase